MTWWLILLPVFSALVGWFIHSLVLKWFFRPYQPIRLFGFTIQGMLPASKKSLAEKIGAIASNDLFSFSSIEQKIADPENLERIMPLIEKHVDEFLRVKLPAQMPMIGMFIGEKTIATMKTIFMQELGTLFPEIMKHYALNLRTSVDLEKMITEKIMSLPMATIEREMTTHLKPMMQHFKLVGAVIGFVIGLLQVLLTLLIAFR